METSPEGGGSRILGLLIMVVIGVCAVVAHKAFGRWWAKNEPLAGAKIKIADTKAKAYDKVDSAALWAEFLADIGLEISLAREIVRPPDPEE